MTNRVGALFDLDGVLVDSEGIYTQFWEEMNRLYPTGYVDFAQRIKGTTLEHILTTYFPHEDVQKDIVKRLNEHEEQMQYTLFPGTIDFLKSLMEQNIPAVIVTSSNEKKMAHLFNAIPDFRELFGAVITDKDVLHSKPAPDGYILGAKAIGLSPESCYVFEDSMQGIQAGLSAGATVIGLATTNPREMVSKKAHKTIDSFEGFSISDMLAVSKL